MKSPVPLQSLWSVTAPAGPAAVTILEARVAAPAQAMLEAWTARGVDGTVKVGPHEMPAGLRGPWRCDGSGLSRPATSGSAQPVPT